MNRCTWTETITFEKFIHEPYYDEIKNEQRQRQCENMTDEQFDEYGRAYCKEHRIKVDEINKSRHKNCINKEKLIKDLEERITWLTNEISNVKYFKQIEFYIWEKICLKDFLIKIKNKNIEIGEFDYE
ncbi:hypothetical protein [Spiroplasma endosymbiont of Lasioglossum villosulum]|uniref:hypothetical protein n=1 Tax=Spiroplasma endosymbiont of Lasioglossum villosulum TaxID=3066320 RepID=UPI0030D2ECD5